MRLPPRLHSVLHQPRAIWGHPGDESSPERWAMTWRTTHPGLGAGGSLIVCGLNPSLEPTLGNIIKLDPTLTRIKRVGFENGYEQVCVINLYPLRCTTPPALWEAIPWAFDGVASMVKTCEAVTSLGLPEPWTVVAAWGASAPPVGAFVPGVPGLKWCRADHDHYVQHAARYLQALGGGQLWCWGTTKAGHPRHPLYLPAYVQLQPWRAP